MQLKMKGKTSVRKFQKRLYIAKKTQMANLWFFLNLCFSTGVECTCSQYFPYTPQVIAIEIFRSYGKNVQVKTLSETGRGKYQKFSLLVKTNKTGRSKVGAISEAQNVKFSKCFHEKLLYSNLLLKRNIVRKKTSKVQK